jgi:prolyl-tRNA synthetase
MTKKNAISPTREEDYAKWYQEVIKAAQLAENSVVRGCMVIKPWGYEIWENIQSILNGKIKATGHKNLYFPMFIPLSFLEKEAEHVEGFAKECAVITHHRLEKSPDGGLQPAGKLEEPLVVRPTSEVIIGEAFSRWVKSYRDLPLLYNQWANVVRWEMRPRIFLRTSEFLWQEGHTAHATEQEAVKEAEMMLMVYQNLVEEFLAIPVLVGKKTSREKFPGADTSYCIEAMMQDKKALQAGTSHFLGTNFAKAFHIKFLSHEGKEEFAWTTSWGASTRLIGGLIMTHSDDDGLVLPPRIAPLHVVIIPLVHKEEDRAAIMEYSEMVAEKLIAQVYHGSHVKVEIDMQDKRPGEKTWGWVKKGVPVRVEIGSKELAAQQVFVGRRDHEPSQKSAMHIDEFLLNILSILDDIQGNLFLKAQRYLNDNISYVTSEAQFLKLASSPEVGFIGAYWADDEKTEDMLKDKFKLTPRCIPLNAEHGTCIFTGQANSPLTIFARSY